MYSDTWFSHKYSSILSYFTWYQSQVEGITKIVSHWGQRDLLSPVDLSGRHTYSCDLLLFFDNPFSFSNDISTRHHFSNNPLSPMSPFAHLISFGGPYILAVSFLAIFSSFLVHFSATAVVQPPFLPATLQFGSPIYMFPKPLSHSSFHMLFL